MRLIKFPYWREWHKDLNNVGAYAASIGIGPFSNWFDTGKPLTSRTNLPGKRISLTYNSFPIFNVNIQEFKAKYLNLFTAIF